MALELRTNICVDDPNDLSSFVQDVIYNAQTTNELINNLTEAITNIEASGTSDHKVSVNATDNAALGFDYLHAKFNDAAAYVSGQDALVCVETVSNSTERLFMDTSAISGFPGSVSDTYVLSLVSGAISWTLLGSDSIDSYEVKVTANDSTQSYLHDAFNLNATYVTNADILVGTATVGGSGTNQTERLFVDVSAINSYSATGFFLLGLDDNVSKYVTIETIGTELFSDSTFLTELTDLIESETPEKYRAIRGQATATTTAADATFTIDGVIALDSGLLPSEPVTVHNIPAEAHLNNQDVLADYNEASTRWEARPYNRPSPIRIAIVTEEIPAASGYTNTNITPGKTLGGSNIRLLDYGSGYGDPATLGATAKAENYAKAAILINKLVFVSERAPGIWVVHGEVCQAYTFFSG